MLNSEAVLNWGQTVGVLAALTFTGYELYGGGTCLILSQPKRYLDDH